MYKRTPSEICFSDSFGQKSGNLYKDPAVFFSLIIHLLVILSAVFFPLINTPRKDPLKIYQVNLINVSSLPTLPPSPNNSKKFSALEKIIPPAEKIVTKSSPKEIPALENKSTREKSRSHAKPEGKKKSGQPAKKSTLKEKGTGSYNGEKTERKAAPALPPKKGSLAELNSPAITPPPNSRQMEKEPSIEPEDLINDLKAMEESWSKIDQETEDKLTRQAMLRQLEDAEKKEIQEEIHSKNEIKGQVTTIPLAYQKEVSRLKETVKLPKGVVSYGSDQMPQTILDYYQEIVRLKIYEQWKLPLNELAQRDRKQVIVLFKIEKDGRIKNPAIEKSSRLVSFDTSALEAVKKAAPFPALPEDTGDDFLEVHFIFEYNNIN